MGTIEGIATHKFFEKIERLVIHNCHVVGVPANRTAYVKHQLRYVHQQR